MATAKKSNPVKTVPQEVRDALTRGFGDASGVYRAKDGTIWQLMADDRGNIQGFTNYRAPTGSVKPGDVYAQFDGAGNYVRDNAFTDPGKGLDLLAMGVLAATGASAFLPGIAASGAAVPGWAAGAIGGAGGGAGAGIGGGSLTGSQAGVITAAEAAAGSTSLAESLAPYLANAGTAGAGLSAYVPTAAEAGVQSAALQNQLAPYLAKGAAGAASGLGTKAAGAAATAGAGAGGGGEGGAGNLLTQLLGGKGGIDLSSLLGPGLSLVGGALGSKAAGAAADKQLEAAKESNALLKSMFEKQIALQEPFRQAGLSGTSRLLDLLGLSKNTTAEGYGSAARDFSMSDFKADPGYAFRQAEGEKAINRGASAAGRFNSGRVLKDLTRFNSGLASDEYGQAFNRFQVNRAAKLNPLQSLMGAGQTSANTVGQAAQNYGAGAAGNTLQAGNSAAAGTVGKANAWTNAVNQGTSMYAQSQDRAQQNKMLEYLMARG